MKKHDYEIQYATYTRDNGEVSDRVIIILSEPSNYIMALDLTKIDKADQTKVREFLLTQKQELQTFLTGIKAEWKQFKPAGLKVN
jgi:hypothetical protein